MVSITVEMGTAPGPARVAMALRCGAQARVLFVSMSLLGLSPALNPVTQSHEQGQGQLRSHCPVRSHLPPHVLGEGKASVLPRVTTRPPRDRRPLGLTTLKSCHHSLPRTFPNTGCTRVTCTQRAAARPPLTEARCCDPAVRTRCCPWRRRT